MKPKLKLCAGCNEERVIWKNHKGNRYCKYCWNKQTVTVVNADVAKRKPKPNKPKKPIPRRSSKRAKQEQEYSRKRRGFLLSSETCQARIPSICTGKSTDVHHKAGRVGSLLTDERYWLAVCRQCHEWIELHPIEAKDMGFSINRLNLKKDE